MGTAFGIMGMLESIALATFPVIASTIVTSAENDLKGYSNVGFFFAGIGKQFFKPYVFQPVLQCCLVHLYTSSIRKEACSSTSSIQNNQMQRNATKCRNITRERWMKNLMTMMIMMMRMSMSMREKASRKARMSMTLSKGK
jgi:hypothetical protein